LFDETAALLSETTIERIKHAQNRKAWILGFSFLSERFGDSNIAFFHLIPPQVPAADARSNQPIEANPAPEQRKAPVLPSCARKVRVHTKPKRRAQNGTKA
jgi:hypothetical protein